MKFLKKLIDWIGFHIFMIWLKDDLIKWVKYILDNSDEIPESEHVLGSASGKPMQKTIAKDLILKYEGLKYLVILGEKIVMQWVYGDYYPENGAYTRLHYGFWVWQIWEVYKRIHNQEKELNKRKHKQLFGRLEK